VSEHTSKGFPQSWMGRTLSLAMFGNSVVAIISGIMAQQAADYSPLTPIFDSDTLHAGGYCTPFDMSIVALVLAGGLISVTWDENYGHGETHALSLSAIQGGVALIVASPNILLTGLVQSLFEGSMYQMVFYWTLALTKPDMVTPHGLIFATFMLCCMMGSSLFGVFISTYSCRAMLWRPLAVAAVALGTVAVTDNVMCVYVGFLVFEVCVGMYFPCIGTIKSEVVPEQSRAAVYNLFRVPLNGIVVSVLLANLSVGTSMMLCSAMLGLSAVLAMWIKRDVVQAGSVALTSTDDDAGVGWLAAEDEEDIS